MAMRDYGAVGFKNGKLISTSFFTPMKDTVGWEDNETDIDYDGNPLHLNNDYFLYIGDEKVTICFYKTVMKIVEKSSDDNFFVTYENFGWEKFCGWKKWEHWVAGDIIVKKKNGYYVCKWNYKGDKYKVYFGYGVDLGWYEKSGLVNYYRTNPRYLWHKFKNWVKDIIYDLKNM